MVTILKKKKKKNYNALLLNFLVAIYYGKHNYNGLISIYNIRKKKLKCDNFWLQSFKKKKKIQW